jgi:hypothetical protein
MAKTLSNKKTIISSANSTSKKNIKKQDIEDDKVLSSKEDNDDVSDKEVIEDDAVVAKKVNKVSSIKREKGSAPNADTASIDATFNTNYAKIEMKKYIQNILQLDYGTIRAQYPYVAITELLSLHFIRISAKYNVQNPQSAGLYDITREGIQRAIRECDDFDYYVKGIANDFKNTDMNYSSAFFVDGDKVVRPFLESKALTNSNINITPEALNFICYLLSRIMALLTKTACYLSTYAGKTNVQIKNFKIASRIHFTGELIMLIDQRIAEIETLFSFKKKENEGNADVADAADAADAEEGSDNDDNNDNNDDDDNEQNKGDISITELANSNEVNDTVKIVKKVQEKKSIVKVKNSKN